MDIVIRAAVVFLLLWGVTRVVGRATLGELSAFQLILFVTMGDLVQQAVTQQDYSVTAALLAVGTFAVLTVLLSWLNARVVWLRPITHGHPVVVARDGEVLPQMLRAMRLPEADLDAAARQQGITSMRQVELAVLEVNGRISFFTQDPRSGAPEEPSAG